MCCENGRFLKAKISKRDSQKTSIVEGYYKKKLVHDPSKKGLFFSPTISRQLHQQIKLFEFGKYGLLHYSKLYQV